jgi:preprotein translocase subunit SecG
MATIFVVLIVIAAVLLIIIVLAQNPKGGGLAQGFASSNQIMGVQNTNKFLTKSTWTLIAFIGLFSILVSGYNAESKSDNDADSSLIDKAKTEKAKAANPQKASPFGNSQQMPIQSK